MSRVNQVVCDHCEKVQKDTWDNAMPEWRDPDRWDGWWSLDVCGMDGREHYDLCCLECLKKWVAGKAEWWDQYYKRIGEDAVTYDQAVNESLKKDGAPYHGDSAFNVFVGTDDNVLVYRCQLCPRCGMIRDVRMTKCGCNLKEAE